MNITVKLTSDFICPWCLIGERRLQKVIRRLPADVEVTILWRPYELNPTMPVEGVDRKNYRSAKFGSWEYSQSLDRKTILAAAEDDIAFNYDAMQKTPNTFRAHRLMNLAHRHGVADAVANGIFHGYFEQGRDIGDVAVLADIAGENGLNRAEALAYLTSDAGAKETRAAISFATGIRGVPNFDIEGETISGAQPLNLIEDAIMRAIARKLQEKPAL
jgi:predicted DsbA family dithiol-disulfide isomerase